MRRPGSERDGVWETVRHDVDRECSTYERYVCLRLKPRKTSKMELCPPARRRRTNAAGVAFRPICFRSDASVEPKATAGGVFAELEFREFRAHGGALAPVRALKGTGFPSRDLSGTRPGLAAGGRCRREHHLGLTRGKARGCSHRNRTRARVNARARGSLMVAYCVHPCRSRRRVGLDGPRANRYMRVQMERDPQIERDPQMSGSRAAPPRRARRGMRSRRVPSRRRAPTVTPDLDLRATPRSRPAAARVVRSRYEGARARKPRSHHFGLSSISVISAPKPAGRAGVDGANAASGAWRATCRDELCSTIY
jgi:hypothetical protein